MKNISMAVLIFMGIVAFQLFSVSPASAQCTLYYPYRCTIKLPSVSSPQESNSAEPVTSSYHIQYGARRNGTVSSSAGVRYTFNGGVGERVRMTISSGNMNTYLMLLRPDGTTLAVDDNSGAGSNSYIYINSLPFSGRYTIIATGYGGDTGNYILTLN